MADAFLNVLLFVPLGLALAWSGLRARWAVPLGALLSIAVEVAQLWIPGRDTSIGDVLTNTTGTAAGVLAFELLPSLVALARGHARVLALTVPIATLTGLAAGAVLLRPVFSSGMYYAVWKPGSEHPYFLSGPVTLVRLGDFPLRRRFIPQSDLVSRLWLEGAPLRVEAAPAGDTLREASLFALYDGDGHELLQLGVDGEDVVLRYRTVAAMLRLDQPDMRLQGAAEWIRGKRAALAPGGEAAPPGATTHALAVNAAASGPRRREAGARARLLTGLAAPFQAPRAWRPANEIIGAATAAAGLRPQASGSSPAPARVQAWKRGHDYCLEVNGRGVCGLGYGVARSWAVLLYSGTLSRWASLLDALWLLALFLPSGFLLRRVSAPLTLACALVALGLLPSVTGLLPTAPSSWLGAGAGLAAGLALRRLAGGRGLLLQPLAAGRRASSARASTAMQRSMRS